MNAAEVIAEIKQAGGEIWAEGERLKFRDIPARLVPAIREHNTALLAPGWPVKIPRLWSLQNPPPEARLTVQ